ncbi:MAG: hypothetical protein O3A27_04255 [Actinomycetota bacterium]|nr:hypothetical protein [Actinomycetota bacterium]
MTVLSGTALSKIDRSDHRYHTLLDFHRRLAAKDVTLWGSKAQAEAAIGLNWIDLPESSRDLLPQLDALCAKHRSKTRVILCAMGGSSLGPEVIAQTYRRELFVLDSTDPNYVAHAIDANLTKTLVIVSSKSGSTIETASQLALFESLLETAGLVPHDHIVIVTDPDSPLDRDARSKGFSIVNADPHLGGRFSVLSAFGLVPAALIGVDVSVLLDNASQTKADFLKDPRMVVDMAYAITYLSGQYISYCDLGAGMPGLSHWAEQLVAESTGKNETGRLPIVIESPSRDQIFSIAYTGEADLVISADLASQFIIWEWVTALVAAGLGVNPFNQPNVTEAKEATSSLLNLWAGVAPQSSPLVTDASVEIFGQGQDLTSALQLFIESIPADGYIAIMAYLDRYDDVAITHLRALLSAKSNRPVTFGWGPRFLHSTGQFHKGGQRNGGFLQITGNPKRDIAIPGQRYGFNTLIAAQALGDAQSLLSRKYPLLRLNLIDRSVGIDQLLTCLKNL